MRNYKIEKDFMVDGYRCVIVGQSLGHRCGYIGVPVGHSVYGKEYDVIDLNVHGGLTYSADSKRGYPVESDELWWIGFDTAHYGDSKDFTLIKELSDEREYALMLHMEKKFPTQKYGIIRTKYYVEQQLIQVVEQLKSM